MNLPLFLIPILVGLSAQLVKPLLNKNWYARRRKGEQLPRYGGMPSAHTAFAFSLLTMVGMVNGITSVSFAIMVSLAIFVIDDALRMRVFLGSHGYALHELVKRLPEAERKLYPYLETQLGHKPREVMAGAAVGIAVTWLLMWWLPICCNLLY